MRISESRLRSVIREVIKESPGRVTQYRRSDFPDGRFDFIDNCQLDDLKQALEVYEKMYLLDKTGEDMLHKFLGDYCRKSNQISKKNRFSFFKR